MVGSIKPTIFCYIYLYVNYMKYRIKTKWFDNWKYYPIVQLKKWYGWINIKKFPIYDIMNLENENDETNVLYGEYLPNGKRNITYTDLCAEELLEKLNEKN